MVKRKQSLAVILAVLFLLLCIASSFYLTYRTSEYIIDSDASSELLLGKVLSEEGGILSSNWYYSTELRVLNTQLIYAPLFRVFSDWRTVRWVGQALLNVMLVLSFLFMSKQAGIRCHIRYACAGILLLPMSTIYARIVLMHGYYAPHSIIAFCLLGLIYASTNETYTKGKHRLIIVGLLLLSYAAGLGGIRQIAVSGIPIAAVMMAELLFGDRAALLSESSDCSLSCKMRRLNRTPIGKGFYASIASAAAIVCGFLTHELFLTRIYTLSGEGTITLGMPSIQLLKKTIRSGLKLFGYHIGAEMPSLEGVATILSLVIGLICAVMILQFVIPKTRPKDWRMRSAGWIMPVTAAVLAAVMLLTGKDETRYLLPAVAFLSLFIAAIWEQSEREKQPLFRWITVVLLACCVVNGSIIDRYFIKEHCGETVQADSAIVYEGIEVSEIDLVRDMLPVSEFLAESGYRYGYTEFWRGNIVTELTDGAVEMVIFSPDGYHRPAIYNWLSRRNLFEQARAEDRVFLLMEVWDYEEALAADGGWLPINDPIYEDKQFIVFDMPADNALARLLANG